MDRINRRYIDGFSNSAYVAGIGVVVVVVNKKENRGRVISIIHVERLATGIWCAWAVRRTPRMDIFARHAHDRLEAVGRLAEVISPWLSKSVGIDTADDWPEWAKAK